MTGVPTLNHRFESKVAKGPGCWTWMASKSTTGYGRVSHRNRLYPAHRLALESHLGHYLPKELRIDTSLFVDFGTGYTFYENECGQFRGERRHRSPHVLQCIFHG